MRVVKELGPLHSLLVKGLPDWHDEEGRLRTYDLARHIGISHQAMYKAYQVNRLSTRRIKEMIALSEQTQNRDSDFTPLTFDDFAHLI